MTTTDIALLTSAIVALFYHCYYPVVDPYIITKFKALLGKRNKNNG